MRWPGTLEVAPGGVPPFRALLPPGLAAPCSMLDPDGSPAGSEEERGGEGGLPGDQLALEGNEASGPVLREPGVRLVCMHFAHSTPDLPLVRVH